MTLSFHFRSTVLRLAAIVACLAIVRAEVRGADPAAKSVAEFEPSQLEFFENKIRPVLVEQCYKCHSTEAKKRQGGLLLDSRDGLLEGGDSGAAIVAGAPAESLLLEALRHESLKMPPSGRLPDDVIRDFAEWIRRGAADPRTQTTESAKRPRVLYSEQAAATHWAFQPIGRPKPPEMNDPWVKTPIDAFILAKLREARLEPSLPADRRTLLRRASYDLLGLPPKLAETQMLLADQSADSYSQVVDRLLESPRYGEKWGRHWLDVARYADNNGERLAPSKEAPYYPFAWTYRDYVLDAFNRDLPFDRFIVEQLAGDSLATETDWRPLAALGFLRVGKAFGQNIDDRIDDRIDAISKGFLGLTVACARCHDHKLDPVSQADYYALHGVFSSCRETDSLLRDTAGTPDYAAYQKSRDEMLSQANEECRVRLNEFMHKLALRLADHLIAAERFRDGESSETEPKLAAREAGLQPLSFEAVLAALERWQSEPPAAYRPWLVFASLPQVSFAEQATALGREIASGTLDGQPVPELLAKHFEGRQLRSLRDVAEVYQAFFLEVEEAAQKRYPLAELLVLIDESPQAFKQKYYTLRGLPPPLDDPSLESLRQVTVGFNGPFFMTPRQLLQLGGGEIYKRRVMALHAVVKFDGEHVGAPVLAMGMRDRDASVDSPIFIRGDSKLHGETVARRFLSCLSTQVASEPFSKGSGRLELAEAIASPANPLTARVIVNRVWQGHFGQGLVATPSNFGLNGAAPSHPELLDWLANWFIDQGWSLKRLHRLIMTSSVYQQSSLMRSDAHELDGQNVLLWRFPPRRLTFEELRDTWLAAAGTLSSEFGGRPADPVKNNTRRSVYLYIDRYRLPEVFSNFDFANPEMTTGQRDSTIVPQQALFMMNSAWLTERAFDLVSRPEVCREQSVEGQIRAVFRIVLQRDPDQAELSAAGDYVSGLAFETRKALARLGHALLQLNEVLYVQ